MANATKTDAGFTSMVVTIMDAIGYGALKPEDEQRVGEAVRIALDMVWNTRGAADIVKLEAELTSMMGATAAGPYVKNLDRALRSLDRNPEP